MKKIVFLILLTNSLTAIPQEASLQERDAYSRRPLFGHGRSSISDQKDDTASAPQKLMRTGRFLGRGGIRRGEPMPLRPGMHPMGFNMEMAPTQEIMQFVELIRKHKGNIDSLVRDPDYQKIASVVQTALRKIQALGRDADMSLRLSAPFINYYASMINQALDDPHYASLFGNVAPTIKEIVSLSRSLLAKLGELAKHVSTLEKNPAIKRLIPELNGTALAHKGAAIHPTQLPEGKVSADLQATLPLPKMK